MSLPSAEDWRLEDIDELHDIPDGLEPDFQGREKRRTTVTSLPHCSV